MEKMKVNISEKSTKKCLNSVGLKIVFEVLKLKSLAAFAFVKLDEF